MIFYNGPPTEKSRAPAPTDGGDEMLVRAFEKACTPGMEEFDFTTGFGSAFAGKIRLQLPYSSTTDALRTETRN